MFTNQVLINEHLSLQQISDLHIYMIFETVNTVLENAAVLSKYKSLIGQAFLNPCVFLLFLFFFFSRNCVYCLSDEV